MFDPMADTDDDDYKFALRLAAELNANREESSATASAPKSEFDMDYQLAMQMQYNGWNGAHAEQPQLLIETSEPGQFTAESYPSTSASTSEELLKTSILRVGLAELAEPRRAVFRQDTPPGKVFSTLADFATNLKAKKCPICGERLFNSGLDVSRLFNDWSSGEIDLSSRTKCRICSTPSCVACSLETSTRFSSISFLGKRVYWCCSGGRLFLIFILLCGFDQNFCSAKLKEASIAKAGHKNQNNGKNKAGKQPEVCGRRYSRDAMQPKNRMPSGMGYGSDMATYWDHDGDEDDHFHLFESRWTLESARQQADSMRRDCMAKAQNARQAEDNLNSLILGLLQDLLPSLERQSDFDCDPSEAVTEMLIESKILNYCTELLRNDSLDDATKRKVLYQTLLGFLCTISTHHITASRTVFAEQQLRPDTSNLLVSTFHDGSMGSKDYTQSLAKSISNLSKQSSLVLRAAKNNENDFKSEDGQSLLWICRRVSELSETLIANNNGGSADLTKAPASTSIASPIIDVPDELITATHAYTERARELSTSAAGRFKRLITEITTLTTSLPPGIFVRYASDRPDIMKAVIVGPQGTPYENGLFEFDLFCRGDYPKSPPLMKFKGTGGGKATINPNLYADGKVCLSLLGTWQGEPWKPGESTLLQVLISIQAMIFCDEPWFNEPGRERSYRIRSDTSGLSETYSQKVRGLTVRHAMLDWLDEPPQLWKDVFSAHFKENCFNILTTVNEWAKKSIPSESDLRRPFWPSSDEFSWGGLNNALDGKPAASNISSLLPRLQTALVEFGADPPLVDENAPRPCPENSHAESSRPTNPQSIISRPWMLQHLVPLFSTEAPATPSSTQPKPSSAYTPWLEPLSSTGPQDFEWNAGQAQASHSRFSPLLGRRRNEGSELASQGRGQYRTGKEPQSGGESDNIARQGQSTGLRSFGGLGLFTGRRRGHASGVSSELEEPELQGGRGESPLGGSHGGRGDWRDHRGRGLLFRGRGGRGRGSSGNLD